MTALDATYSRPSCLVPRLRNSAFRTPSSRAGVGVFVLDVVEHLAVLEAVLGDPVDRAQRLKYTASTLRSFSTGLKKAVCPRCWKCSSRRCPSRPSAVVVGVPSAGTHLLLAHALVTRCRSFSWNWWPCLVTVSEQAVSASASSAAHGSNSQSSRVCVAHGHG